MNSWFLLPACDRRERNRYLRATLTLVGIKARRKVWVSLGVRTCELFLCFVTIVRVRAIVLTSLFSLFYVTCEFHRFLHRGRAKSLLIFSTEWRKIGYKTMSYQGKNLHALEKSQIILILWSWMLDNWYIRCYFRHKRYQDGKRLKRL